MSCVHALLLATLAAERGDRITQLEAENRQLRREVAFWQAELERSHNPRPPLNLRNFSLGGK